jgi:DNA-binding CsgD family transcriptional regulator
LRVATFPRLNPRRSAEMLTVVALRLAADQHRQPQRRRAALRRLFASTSQRSPEDVALDRLHALQMLDCAHEQLGGHERSVLLLRAQGVGAAEAAAQMGVSYKSAESAYTRARRKLRAAGAVVVVGMAATLRRLHYVASTSPMAVAAGALACAVLAAPPQYVAGSAAPHAGLVDKGQRILLTSNHARPDRTVWLASPGRAGSAAQGDASSPVATKPRSRSAAEATQVAAVRIEVARGGAPASVERSHQDDSFSASVQNCLSTGVSLDPQHLGCP